MARIPTVAGSQVAVGGGGGGGASVRPTLMQASGGMRGGGEMRNQPVQGRKVNAVTLDATALNARYRGQEAIGQAMHQASGFMTAVALQQQEHVNKGLLAQEETIRMETAAQIQTYMDSNADKPEEWARFSNDTWKAYETSRGTRQQEQNWAPVVANVDKVQYQSYRAETAVRFQQAENKALIRQSNSRIEANAQAKLRGGDYVGFVQQMDQLNAFPEQKEEAIRRGLEEGTYKIAGNQLDAIGQLPPSMAVPAYKAYIASLTAKDEDGNYQSYEMGRGGMSLGGRVNLESIANARIRETQRSMDTSGRRLVSEMRLGRATAADVSAAVEAGQIDVRTAQALAPDFELAALEKSDRDQKEADRDQAEIDRKAESAASKARTMENATEATRRDALERGRVGMREIDRQLAFGEINPDQASKLKAELQQASIGEQGLVGGDYASISGKLKSAMGSKLGGAQPEDSKYQELLGSIINAKVTQPTRLKLMSQLFDLKLADIDDLEEEGPEDGRWMDRTITAPERDMRRNLIASYRSLLPALGDAVAGDLLMNQEAKIRGFFDTAGQKGRSEAEINAFVQQRLMPEIQEAAGYEAINDAFNF